MIQISIKLLVEVSLNAWSPVLQVWIPTYKKEHVFFIGQVQSC